MGLVCVARDDLCRVSGLWPKTGGLLFETFEARQGNGNIIINIIISDMAISQNAQITLYIVLYVILIYFWPTDATPIEPRVRTTQSQRKACPNAEHNRTHKENIPYNK